MEGKRDYLSKKERKEKPENPKEKKNTPIFLNFFKKLRNLNRQVQRRRRVRGQRPPVPDALGTLYVKDKLERKAVE